MIIIYVIPDIGYYHHARINALCSLDNKTLHMGVLELFSNSGFKEFQFCGSDDRTYEFKHLGLGKLISLSERKKGQSLLNNALDEFHPDVVCIAGWSEWYALATLSWCNQHGVPSIVMSESTAHDEARRGWKEAIKRRVISLYSAGLVGGKPHVDYLSALGMPRERIFTSYDVVDNLHFSVGADEARRNADHERTRLTLPPRFFLASNRFIEKKNLPRLLDAYARYRHQAGESAWKLV
ncbi:MAG: hypothetical protein LM514_05295, partial [Streptococcus sp.]|nr:hypothetical protein [Streptococcus sp.]